MSSKTYQAAEREGYIMPVPQKEYPSPVRPENFRWGASDPLFFDALRHLAVQEKEYNNERKSCTEQAVQATPEVLARMQEKGGRLELDKDFREQLQFKDENCDWTNVLNGLEHEWKEHGYETRTIAVLLEQQPEGAQDWEAELNRLYDCFTDYEISNGTAFATIKQWVKENLLQAQPQQPAAPQGGQPSKRYWTPDEYGNLYCNICGCIDIECTCDERSYLPQQPAAPQDWEAALELEAEKRYSSKPHFNFEFIYDTARAVFKAGAVWDKEWHKAQPQPPAAEGTQGQEEALMEFLAEVRKCAFEYTDDLDETCVPYKWAEYKKVVDVQDVEQVLQRYHITRKTPNP